MRRGLACGALIAATAWPSAPRAQAPTDGDYVLDAAVTSGSGDTEDADHRAGSAFGQPAASTFAATDGFTLDPGLFGVNVAQRAMAMDVRPGVTPAVIVAGEAARGRVPVAFLASADFDPLADVLRSTLTLGRTGTEPSLVTCALAGADVDGDGLLDLTCDFDPRLMDLADGGDGVLARGWSASGELLMASDAIVAVEQGPPLAGEGPDGDGDGIPDDDDACPAVADSGADYDCDRAGDACDTCPATWNPGQEDSDGDGIGNSCDYAWGDVVPSGAPDGLVRARDLVQLVRYARRLDAPGLDALRRGNVAPAAGSLLLRPTLAEPQRLDDDDVATARAVVVGRASFAAPRDLPDGG